MKIYADSSFTQGCFMVEGQEPVVQAYPRKVTVNGGEYRAVLFALWHAIDHNYKSVEILTDSLLVANQVNGLWKCRKQHLLPLHQLVRTLLLSLDAKITWIPREENLAGIELEKRR